MKNRPYLGDYKNRVKQFEEDQKKPALLINTPPEPQKALPEASEKVGGGEMVVKANPYLKARLEVLSRLSPADRAQILEIEKTGVANMDNKVYAEFIATIIAVAEQDF